jgi:hypothetical protein
LSIKNNDLNPGWFILEYSGGWREVKPFDTDGLRRAVQSLVFLAGNGLGMRFDVKQQYKK